MTPEELSDMNNKLVKISSHPTVSADDARYAMSCALALLAEVRRLRHRNTTSILKAMDNETEVHLPYVTATREAC